MKTPEHPVLVGLLGLPARLYGAAVALRNRRYDRGDGIRRAGLPVISVGNLTVGGTGKTPLVAWLARELIERGKRPAVVSRVSVRSGLSSERRCFGKTFSRYSSPVPRWPTWSFVSARIANWSGSASRTVNSSVEMNAMP